MNTSVSTTTTATSSSHNNDIKNENAKSNFSEILKADAKVNQDSNNSNSSIKEKSVIKPKEFLPQLILKEEEDVSLNSVSNESEGTDIKTFVLKNLLLNKDTAHVNNPNTKKLGKELNLDIDNMDTLEDVTSVQGVSKELFGEDLLSVLKEVAVNSLSGEKNTDNSDEGIHTLLNILTQVTETINKIPRELNFNMSDMDAKTLEGIKDKLQDLNNLILQGEETKEIMPLKELISGIGNVQNELLKLSKSIEMPKETTVKFNELITKLNKAEDVLIKIKQESVFSNPEVEVIHLLKEEKSNSDVFLNEEGFESKINEIGENSLEDNIDNTDVSDVSIIRSEVTPTTDKGVKNEKVIDLNLDQLKEKVSDKLNLIEKMTISKDKMLISLNPKNMGNVELFFKKTDSGMDLVVEFDEKDTKHKLETIFDEIKRDFKEKNIDLNFIFKEKEKNPEENSERKKESKDEERMLENENEPEQTFQEVMKRVLRGE
ncbi:hypothetical protein U8V72_11195 [Priestia filamentosa]|uniref:hypothetical protein n=1 Tax=Priestia filamentosa TaxID=1402861 RepID=UPI00397BB4CC